MSLLCWELRKNTFFMSLKIRNQKGFLSPIPLYKPKGVSFFVVNEQEKPFHNNIRCIFLNHYHR